MLPNSGSSLFRKIFAFIFIAVILVPAYIYISNPVVVTVNGVGEVEAKPDIASVAFVVAVQRETSERAIVDVEAKAKSLESVLVGFGIDNSNVVRSQVSITPSGLDDKSKAYTGTISMGSKMDTYNEAGNLVKSLYSNGAYYVSQPILSSSNLASLEAQAYDKAVKDANSQAGSIALKNFKFLKKKVSISQATTNGAGTITSLSSQTKDQDTNKELDPNAVFTDALKVSKVVTVVYKMW